MSLVNKIRGNNRTFGDIAMSIFMIAIQSGNTSSRIDNVFDVYQDNSTKTTESEDRGVATGIAHGSIAASWGYNSGVDCCEFQQVKLPSSNLFSKHGEMIHT